MTRLIKVCPSCNSGHAAHVKPIFQFRREKKSPEI